VLRWVGTLLWAVANLLIGVCAILPLGLGLTLTAGRPALFEVGGNENGRAVAIVVVTLLVLGGMFGLVNVPFRRRSPVDAARLVWPAATGLVLAPFAVALAFS
jgi:hypothetical protein